MTSQLHELSQQLYQVQIGGLSSLERGVWTQDEIYLELLSKDAKYFLWMPEANLQGFVLYRVVLDELWIMHLAVREKGQGYGSSLFEEFKKELHLIFADKLLKMSLEVSAHNIRALSLYKSLGFKELARRARYYRNGDDAIVMELDLGFSSSH